MQPLDHIFELGSISAGESSESLWHLDDFRQDGFFELLCRHCPFFDAGFRVDAAVQFTYREQAGRHQSS
jgi:hypothetical protein